MAVTIQRYSGNGQSQGYNKAFTEGLKVYISDNSTIPPTPQNSGTVVFQSMGNSGTDPFVTFSGGGSQGAEVSSGYAGSVRPVSNAIAGKASVRCWGFGTEVFFTLNIKAPSGPPAPGEVGNVTGDNQVILQGAGPALPITVTVRDQYDNPYQNAQVTFALPGTGPGGTFNDTLILMDGTPTPFAGTTATVTSDSAGVAVSPAFTVNSQLGTWPMTATLVADSQVSTTLYMTTAPAGGVEVCTAALVPVGPAFVVAKVGSDFTWLFPERWTTSTPASASPSNFNSYGNFIVIAFSAAQLAAIPNNAEITRLTYNQQMKAGIQFTQIGAHTFFEKTAFASPQITGQHNFGIPSSSANYAAFTKTWTQFYTPNLGSKLYGRDVKDPSFRFVMWPDTGNPISNIDARFLTVTICYIEPFAGAGVAAAQFCEV